MTLECILNNYMFTFAEGVIKFDLMATEGFISRISLDHLKHAPQISGGVSLNADQVSIDQ